MRGKRMKPKLIRLPALRLAGFICSTTTRFGENFTAIPKFWREYLHDGRMERLQHEDFIKSHVQYGVCFPEEPITGNFQYLIGVEVKEEAAVPLMYEVRELPPAAYAVFSSEPAAEEKFSAAVYNTWAYIYGSWLPRSGLHIDGRSCDFEFYDDRAMAETGKVCDVYVPVICTSAMTTLPDMPDKLSVEKQLVTGECSVTGNFPAALEFVHASPKTAAVNV
jgi:AraC family transcriptional regulator